MHRYAHSTYSVNPSPSTFRDFAPSMRRAGFAVLPSRGKAPLMAKFNTWQHAPGPAIVEQWADKHPDADIVFVPGLSRTKRRGGNPIVIVDGDDDEACERIVETFGDTPGKVRTRRGRHFMYEDRDGRSLGKLSSLRKLGINADVKHGQNGAGIVAAPPSTHEKEPTFRYGWDGCDETVIGHLPAFDRAALQSLMDAAKPAQPEREIAARVPDAMRDDSRGLWINDSVFKYALAGSSQGAALEMGFRLNESLAGSPRGKLDADEVFARSLKAWEDAQGKRHHQWGGPRRSMVRVTKDEIDALPSDALKLLAKLRAEHSAEANKTFAISAAAMSSFMPRKRIEKARAVLLKRGQIVKVSEASNSAAGRKAAQFKLASSSNGGGAAAGAA